MKNVPACLLILLLPLLPLITHAQKKLLVGFYVDLNGDTTRGFIAARTRYGPAFEFRPSLKNEGKILTPNDVRYFGLEDGTEFQAVGIRTPSGMTNEFARSIVIGSVDLLHREEGYVFVDEKNISYPIAGSRGASTEEARTNYQKNAGTFNILFFGCDQVNEKAKRIEIGETALRDLLREYAKCKQVRLKELKRAGAKIFVGPFVGYSMAKISY